MACRDEVLTAFARLEQRHDRRDFSLDEIVQEVGAAGTTYKVSKIHEYVTSRMCKDAPGRRSTANPDLEKVGTLRYRRLTT